jgi:hypothetical protein
MKMNIKFDHSIDKIDELVEKAEITDIPEGVDEDEIRTELLDFSMNIQNFHLGLLVEFLNLKNDIEMGKVSEFTESIFKELGWDKFQKFAGSIAQSLAEVEEEQLQEAVQEAEKELKELGED